MKKKGECVEINRQVGRRQTGWKKMENKINCGGVLEEQSESWKN